MLVGALKKKKNYASTLLLAARLTALFFKKSFWRKNQLKVGKESTAEGDVFLFDVLRIRTHM